MTRDERREGDGRRGAGSVRGAGVEGVCLVRELTVMLY